MSKAVLERALNSTAIRSDVTEFQLEKDMSEIGEGGEDCSGGKWTMPRITNKREKAYTPAPFGVPFTHDPSYTEPFTHWHLPVPW